MIIYSKGESDILGVKFGRTSMDKSFTDFEVLKTEIVSTGYDYLRIRIDNPTNISLDGIRRLGKSLHLLEILRTYSTQNLQAFKLDIIHEDYSYKAVSLDTIDLFLQIFEETYEDIPFGSYTPHQVLEKFTKAQQWKCLYDFFSVNYMGDNPDALGFIIYNPIGEAVGCLTIDAFEEETYTYFVGVKKAYRNNDILFKTINFIHHYAQGSGRKYAKGAARLHNIFSQRAFDKSGMDCLGYTWIYLVGVND
jgi:hypothetical protein